MIALFNVWSLSSHQQQNEIHHPGFDSSSFRLRQHTNHATATAAATLRAPSSSFQRQQKRRRRRPTHHACENYTGVLHIASGDDGAAAGTLFFQYVINQLIYAEKYNLLPWIHLNNISKHAYDPVLHGGGQQQLLHSAGDSTTQKFDMLRGMSISWTSHQMLRFGYGSYPGKPIELQDLKPYTYTVHGTGVWEHYFLPVSDFVPGDASCVHKPLLKMHYYHLNPSLLFYTPWSVKSWPYTYLPNRLQPTPTQSLQEWYQPMRQKGHEMVQKYIHFQPTLLAKAANANKTAQEKNNMNCLAMHVRHSDKAGSNRRRIPLDKFLPYVLAYAKAGGPQIYLATDSTDVISTIRKKWPLEISRMVTMQTNILRSSNKTAVFSMTTTTAGTTSTSHDQTNIDVLVDILNMSKCRFLLHGFSAVSEATFYLNYELHKKSVDLEDHPSNHRMSVVEFEQLVRRDILQLQQQDSTTTMP
jgi:hypothetical protein